MLRNDLYTIGPLTERPSALTATVTINARHPVFGGHFPGQPVFPGVCMLDIIQEILALRLGCELRIVRGPVIKFLAMIIPEKNPVISVDIQYEEKDVHIAATARIFREETVFMKCQLEFVQAPAFS